MNATETDNIEVVRRYFVGCQTGDIDTIAGTLDADVIHYFLPSRFPPVKGAQALAKYWRAYKLALSPSGRSTISSPAMTKSSASGAASGRRGGRTSG